jgi:hypothetical protein
MCDIEPLIAEFCIHLARLGEPLTKTSVLTRANDLIQNTQALVDFKIKHKIELLKLGLRWYQGFMKRN